MACNTSIEPAEKINNPEETVLHFLFKVQAHSNDWEDQFNRYKSESIVDYNSNILNWWRDNEAKFPLLAKLAKDYLYIYLVHLLAKKEYSRQLEILSLKNETVFLWIMLIF